MMTTIQMLQVAGLVVVGMIGRAALVLAFILALSLPLMAYAYVARAVSAGWHRHHPVGPAAHHA